MPKRDSFRDAHMALRRAALAYAEIVNAATQRMISPFSPSVKDVDQALMDAAIDFTTISSLKLASEDRKRKKEAT